MGIAISLKKIANKITVGLTRLVWKFDKHISGVKKYSKDVKTSRGAENNFKVIYPINYKEQSLPIIFYFHGGGWVEYDKSIYYTLCKRYAQNGYLVADVDYSLAPLNKMHKIISDCINTVVEGTDYLVKHYNAKHNIILAGDSAGAHISSLIAGLVTSGKIVEVYPEFAGKKINIYALLLFYGVFNLETVESSNFPGIKTYLKAVMGDDYNNKDVLKKYSPTTYITNKFPPAFIASGEVDKLHKSQSLELYKQLESLECIYENLFFAKSEKFALHGFMAFDDLKTNFITREKSCQFLNKLK